MATRSEVRSTSVETRNGTGKRDSGTIGMSDWSNRWDSRYYKNRADSLFLFNLEME